MKHTMVITGFLCSWGVFLAVMPDAAQARGFHSGTFYPGGSWSDDPGPRFIEDWFASEEKEPTPVNATSVKEANGTTPDCQYGYRWARARPDDPITKISC